MATALAATAERPISDALRQAIDGSIEGGITRFGLAKQCQTSISTISMFMLGSHGLELEMTDRFFRVFGLKVVRDAGAHGPEQMPQLPSDSIRSAIEGSGMSAWALARASGVGPSTIRRFMLRKSDLFLSTADVLATFFGLKVVRDAGAHGPEPEPPVFDHLHPIAGFIRSAIEGSGMSAWALAKRSGLSHPTIQRFINKERYFTYLTASKLADALGFDLRREILRLESTPHRPDTGPWGDWDEARCPAHVREDSHLVVFGRDKGALSKSARKLFETLEARYPGGFDTHGFRKAQVVGDYRGIMTRWREKDEDCRAAIQLPLSKGSGLYRFGKPDESTIVESTPSGNDPHHRDRAGVSRGG